MESTAAYDLELDFIAFSQPTDCDLFSLIEEFMRVGPIQANAELVTEFKSPYHDVWIAVVEQAVKDARYRGHSEEKLRDKRDALEWLFQDHPFLNKEIVRHRDWIMQVAGFSLDLLRMKLQPEWINERGTRPTN